MTYTDQVGTVGSSAPLVNDLQLRVKLNGDVFVPHFNSYSNINNVEMVDIAAPCASCNYTIEVRAVSLSAVQPYALVASGVLTNADNTSGGSLTNWVLIGIIAAVVIVSSIVIVCAIYFLCGCRRSLCSDATSPSELDGCID
jgi:hypothetical protein